VTVREDDAEVNVDVGMRLVVIGRIQARLPATTSHILTRASPLGKLSQNLYELMNKTGGANVLTDASGSLVGISLEGRDPRMTEYGFDGTRIPEPGALRALDADLLASAQLDDAKSEADFYTLAPTTYPNTPPASSSAVSAPTLRRSGCAAARARWATSCRRSFGNSGVRSTVPSTQTPAVSRTGTRGPSTATACWRS